MYSLPKPLLKNHNKVTLKKHLFSLKHKLIMGKHKIHYHTGTRRNRSRLMRSQDNDRPFLNDVQQSEEEQNCEMVIEMDNFEQMTGFYESTERATSFLCLEPPAMAHLIITNIEDDLQIIYHRNNKSFVIFAKNEFKNGNYFISFCEECENKDKFSALYGGCKLAEFEFSQLIDCKHKNAAMAYILFIFQEWKANVEEIELQNFLLDQFIQKSSTTLYTNEEETIKIYVDYLAEISWFTINTIGKWKCMSCKNCSSKCSHGTILSGGGKTTVKEIEEVNTGNLIISRSRFEGK